MLEIADLCAGYRNHPVLDQVSMLVRQGSFIGIIGPNGSGKSTLMQVLARTLEPDSGSILLDGEDLTSYSFRDFGGKVGFVPQENGIPFAYPVYEIVMMGRNPHIPRFRQPSPEDHARVREALDLTGTAHLADRTITSLSGGERQRVMIARIIAQDTGLLLLDEPFAHIDLRHQYDLIRLIRETSRGKKAVIAVFHDINLAAAYCDHLILLHDGKIRSSGTPREILREPILQEIFGITPVIGENPLTGTPHLYMTGKRPQKPESLLRLHLVSGGGTGIPVLSMLVSAGYRPSCGILSEQDTDCLVARHHGLSILTEPPFSQVSLESEDRLLDLIGKADRVILTAMPVGWGNYPNIRALLKIDPGKIILLLPDSNPVIPDFTNGAATSAILELISRGAKRVNTLSEIPVLLGEAGIPATGE